MTKKNSGDKRGKWVACPVEAQYFGDDRKIARFERKLAQAKDRSKHKKTDQKKREEISDEKREQLKRGRVLSIASQKLTVDHDGEVVTCVLRGSLKKERSKAKNLVTVGDYVLFESTADGEGAIAYIEERQSVLSRADNLDRKREQLIAANIDQVLITVSVVSPPLKPFIVDRYIIAAKKGNMTPIIVVNKVDLLKDNLEEEELYHEFHEAWKKAGIQIIDVSANTKTGLDKLRLAMRDKASVFSGQSGVGKSSLINALTGLELVVGEVVEHTKKGSHTTSTAHLVPLSFGGWVIDTPGIKSFGVWELEKEELDHYFSDIHAFSKGCKYPDCAHLKEDECAVLDAIENEEISELRYASYQYLLESLEEEHKRR